MTGAKMLETRAVVFELEIAIDAPRDHVWQALVDETNAWWLPDFHMVGEGSIVTLAAARHRSRMARKRCG